MTKIMKKLKICYIYLLCLGLVQSAIIIKNHEFEIKLAKYATEVYQHYIDGGKTTLVIFRETSSLVCDMFLQMIAKSGHSMPLLVNSLDKELNVNGKHENDKATLTILFTAVHNIGRILLEDVIYNKLPSIPAYQIFSRYLLVYTSETAPDLQWIEAVFKYFWSQKIMRIFIALWRDGVKVYTFNPFSKEFSKDISNESFQQKKEYLEFELHDCMGYPLNVFLWDDGNFKNRVLEKRINGKIKYTGFDGNLLTQVRDSLNVTLEIIRESETDYLNGYSVSKNSKNWEMLYAPFLKKYKIDILFTAVRARAAASVDSLFLHKRDDYVIVVPKGEKIPEYLYIFLVIPSFLWLSTVVLFLLFSFILYLIRNVKNARKKLYVQSIFDVYRILLNISGPTTQLNLQERVTIISWLIYTMFFSAVLNSGLVSTLLAPKFYSEINTIDELVKTNLSIWVTPYEENFLKEVLTDKNIKLLKNIRVSTDENFTTSMYNFQNYSGFLLRFEKANEFIRTMEDKTVKYHMMDEHPVPNAQTYLMLNNHPFSNVIQWIIHKVHENGLWYEWSKNNYNIESISANVDPEPSLEDELQILKLYHLQTTFYLLLIGLFFSFLVFAFEYLRQDPSPINMK